jgi:hypothetical protein
MQIAYLLASGQPATITPDACVEEAHNSSADVTEDAVEVGAPVSDHVRQKPEELTLDIVISNSPIEQPVDQMSGVTSSMQAVQLTGQKQQATVLTFSGNFDRVGVVHDELIRLKNEGVLLTITTSLRTYDNMVLRSINANRNARLAHTLTAQLGFKQVRIAQTQTAPAPSIPRASSRNARGQQAANAQTGQPATQANASFWSRATNTGISVTP